MLRRYRVVIAKPGLDGHDRGAKVIARALRDAGFEVIYTGLFQTPEQVAEATLQEDADAVGLSLLSGAHMTLIPKIVSELQARDLGDVLVFAGGIIPPDDVATLEAQGVVGGVHARLAALRDHRLARIGARLARAPVGEIASHPHPPFQENRWTCSSTKASSCSRATASRCRPARRCRTSTTRWPPPSGSAIRSS